MIEQYIDYSFKYLYKDALLYYLGFYEAAIAKLEYLLLS
jgi:hypothetical protein